MDNLIGQSKGRTTSRMYAPRIGRQTEDKTYKFVDIFEPLPWSIPALQSKAPVVLFTGSAGGGKAVYIMSEIPTPTGWKIMADLKVGDYVFGSDGMPTRIVAATDTMYGHDCYDVEFDDGTIVCCDRDHLWYTSTVASRASRYNYKKTLKSMGGAYRNKPRGSDQRRKRVLDSVVTTKHIGETVRTEKSNGRLNHAVRIAAPIQLPEADLDIDPYLLGIWLGDGNRGNCGITIHDNDVDTIEEIRKAGYVVKKIKTKYRWSIPNRQLHPYLRRYGILNDKRVPSAYFLASESQRLSLLQGLIDSDGHIGTNGRVSIDLAKLDLLEDVRELVCSLGIKASNISASWSTCNGKKFRRYRMSFRTTRQVARLPRKKERIAREIRKTQGHRFIVDVRKVESVPVKCIQVENKDGLYLTSRSFIPTHNSMAAAQKVHAFCLTYPGATALIVRKTKSSMHNSTIAFLKKKVFGRYLRNGKMRHNITEQRFEYTNGSVIVYGGMANEDQRESIRSIGQEGGIDITWMEEATQFDEADFNEVSARMRGSATDWRQVILTTNPDAPTHWIYQRMILAGEAAIFRSNAADNYHNPADYETARLDNLRGVERDRLRDGRWVQAGGLVLDGWLDDYDNVDIAVSKGNVTTEAAYIPGGGPVFWWIDDGYTGERDKVTNMFKAGSHPRVFLFAQIRPDGTVGVFYENYQVKLLAPEHIGAVMTVSRAMGWPKPSRVVYDKAAASLGGHLKQQLGEVWKIPPAYIIHNAVPVEQGNRELNTWVSPDVNGVRRLVAHPSCKYLRLEAVTYKINPKTGRVVKDFDHGPDGLRMGVWDLVYGGPAEVDVASINDVGLLDYDDEFSIENEDGIVDYGSGSVSIAVFG